MYDVACQVLEYTFEAIESDYHRNADVLYDVEVINLGTVSNICGKQIIVLVGREHLHIGRGIGTSKNTLGSLGDLE